MDFTSIAATDEEKIEALSQLAVGIVRAYFDPIIGAAQNDYMIQKFQSPKAIREQIRQGAFYYFVSNGTKKIGFLSYYPIGNKMYLSKFYLLQEERGRGYARGMLEFIVSQALKGRLASIVLHVNRNNPVIEPYEQMGFAIVAEEKNDIGGGFFMDDYVMQYSLKHDL